MTSVANSHAAPNQPPVAVPTKQKPGAPTSPTGAFLSGKNPQGRAGSRRRSLGVIPAGEDEQVRLDAVLRHRNPLLEASRVLLRALADMPELIRVGHDEALRNLLMDEVRTFERLCERANIRVEHTIGARYGLCAALDEVAMRELDRDAVRSANWAANALMIGIREDNRSGAKVYALTSYLLNDPDEHAALMEVIYRLLCLGFEGQYGANGRRQRDRYRERLYQKISRHAPSTQGDLSDSISSTVTIQRRLPFEIPVWMSAMVLSAALLGLYGYAHHVLDTMSQTVKQQITEAARAVPTASSDLLRQSEP